MRRRTARAEFKILVTEPEEAWLRLIAVLLGREGYQVITVKEPDEAPALIKSHRPDLLILGTKTADEKGLALCRTIRSNLESADIPIILTCRRGHTRDQLPAVFGLGLSQFLTVPVDPLDLLYFVDRALGVRRQDGADR